MFTDVTGWNWRVADCLKGGKKTTITEGYGGIGVSLIKAR